MKAGDVLVSGIGYNDINGERYEQWYIIWNGMIDRCYSNSFHERCPTYIGCIVCDEWLIASNFKQWFSENYIPTYDLDKDILGSGKLYSPETCCFVPKHINYLFGVKRSNKFGTGVSYHKHTNTYTARYRELDRRVSLGYYETIEEARNAYKEHKLNYVYKVLNEYYTNGTIQHNVYTALMNKATTLYGE